MNSAHNATPGRRRGAPPAGRRLTRDAVLERAEALIERDGRVEFSLRSLARELDVRPAALYNHVEGRDDLLDAVAARFVGGFEVVAVGEQEWPRWIRSVALDWLGRMRQRPELAELMLTRAPGTAAGTAFLRNFVGELSAAGVDRATAHVAWHAVLSTVIGFAQQERLRSADRTGTFEAVLDVVLAGIVAAAGTEPTGRALALLRAHGSAHD